MEIYIDTANLEEIKEIADWGILSGVTTNPSLIAKEGFDFKTIINEITTIVDGPISAEVNSPNSEEMIKEAKTLACIHKNIIIKIPITEEGLKSIKILHQEGIKTNATLIFSPSQALLASLAGASYVSPFLGRIDDISWDGISLIRDIKKIFDLSNSSCRIIAASIRNPIHVVDCAKAGADISTIPYSTLKQLIKHPLTDIGISKFQSDWEKHVKELQNDES